MPRHEQELNAMGRVAEKCSPCLHALENPATALSSEIYVATAFGGDKANASLTAMRIQVVHNKAEFAIWIGADHVVEILQEVHCAFHAPWKK